MNFSTNDGEARVNTWLVLAILVPAVWVLSSTFITETWIQIVGIAVILFSAGMLGAVLAKTGAAEAGDKDERS